MDEPDAPPATLHREQTRLMVLWGAGLAFATKFGTILLSLVLARLIAPDLYGQYGAVSTIILFAMSFSMQRFSENIFHNTPTPEDYHRHITFGIILHSLLFLIVNIAAFIMSYDEKLKDITVYLHVGSIAILLNVPRIVYVNHLRLSLKWQKIRLLSILSFLMYATSAIVLASLDLGVWALLTQNLLVPVPYVVAFALDDRRLKGLNFNWRAYREAFQFGLIRLGGSAAGTAYSAVESLTFSLALDFGALGVFNRAKGLSQLATAWLSDQLGGILYPSLAGLASRSDVARRTAGLLLRMTFWISGTAAIAVAAAPQAAVGVLYGANWGEVVPLVRPVLLVALASSVLSMASLVLLTNLGPRHALALDVSVVSVNALGLILVVHGGAFVYAGYLAAANVAMLAAALVYMVRMGLFDRADVIRAVSPTIVATAAVLACAGTPMFVAAERTWPIQTLLGTAAACTLTMLALIRLLDPRGLETILGLLPGGALARRLMLLRPRNGA